MAEIEEQGKVQVNNGDGDGIWREKMVEEDNGLWTVECLRGRLLAERLASKAAKQDAELMGRKLIELEQRLRLEIKFKNKAEKTLKFLLDKLESLKLSPRGYTSSLTASSCITTPGEQTSKTENYCNSVAATSLSSSSLTSEDLRKVNMETGDVTSPGSGAPSVSSSTGDEDASSKHSEKTEDCTGEESVNSDLGRKVDDYVDDKRASITTGVRLTSHNLHPRVPDADNRRNNPLAALRDAKELRNSTVKGNVPNFQANAVSC